MYVCVTCGFLSKNEQMKAVHSFGCEEVETENEMGLLGILPQSHEHNEVVHALFQAVVNVNQRPFLVVFSSLIPSETRYTRCKAPIRLGESVVLVLLLDFVLMRLP